MGVNYNFRVNKIFLSVSYFALVFSYSWIIIPYGIENNDGGFILGLAYQFYQGGRLYEDIFYVRPPISIMLHSFVFLSPFDFAPVLWSRLFFVFQIAVYSALAGALVGRLFKFNRVSIFFVCVLSFIFSFHNFPPMAWHTVDGVFFSVLAVFFAVSASEKSSLIKSFLAISCAALAALSKQPFYITPVLVFLLMLYPISTKKLVLTVSCTAVSALVFYLVLSKILDFTLMLEAISSQTSLRDLVSAGILNYLRDWLSIRTVLTSGPLGAALLLWGYFKFKDVRIENIRYFRLFFLLSVVIFFLSLLQTFLVADQRVNPGRLIDSIFTVSAFLSVVEFLRTREEKWFVIVAMHAIAWAASISWGYTTTALYSSPSILVVVIVLRDIAIPRFISKILVFGVVVISASSFFIGNKFLYSLEGSVMREESIVPMGEKFPMLFGIYGTEMQADAYHELDELIEALGHNVVIAPNWPLFNVVWGGKNPLGIDWLLNAEVGSYELAVRERLNDVAHVIVFLDASPSPESEGRFGSDITVWVKSNWHEMEMQSRYFDVFRNPKFKGDSK